MKYNLLKAGLAIILCYQIFSIFYNNDLDTSTIDAKKGYAQLEEFLLPIVTDLSPLSTIPALSTGFISVWNTELSGVSADNEIEIPINPSFNYNYNIDWGDGNIDSNVTTAIAHTYATPGVYTVQISGTFPSIYFNNRGDKNKIIEILQWGDIAWESFESSFYGCVNLNFDNIDRPDLSNVTSLKDTFRGCTAFNGIINNWDVSTVTDLTGTFRSCSTFNRPLDNWNTTRVTTIASLFQDASLFNEPLDSWNTANVINMSGTFQGATNFNQNISNWLVNEVVDMSFMFSRARNFNRSLSTWVVSKVTNMRDMFNNSNFNQPINNWNVSAVTNMSGMFARSNFNQPLDRWDVSNVTLMNSMFEQAYEFNQPLNDWNVSSVTDMREMFAGFSTLRTAFNQPLDQWDVSSVLFMREMFKSSSFNQNIENWNVSNVEAMEFMFELSNFDQPLNSWDVSKVTTMNGMFKQSLFNQNINGWNVENVTTTAEMFQSNTVFNQPLNNWALTATTTLRSMFDRASSFNQNLDNWTVGNVTDFSRMFNDATSFNQDLGAWNIVNATQLENMLNNSGLSQENYDNLLVSWSAKSVQSNITLGATGLEYCDGRFAREELINTYNWSFTGDAINCSFVVCNTFIQPENGSSRVPSNFDLVWNAAPNATGYRITVSYERSGNTFTILNNVDVGNVLSYDFPNDFQAGDIVTAIVIPFNDEGSATNCNPISFTIIDNWSTSPDAFILQYDSRLDEFRSPPGTLRIAVNRDFTYNYDIDWGDGQYDTGVSNDITHNYNTPGIYNVAIIGTYPSHYSRGNSDPEKLIDVVQWGTNTWLSMNSTFYTARNMVYTASDRPDLSQVTDMASCFESSAFNGNINDWDVSNVQDMSRTFIGMALYNQPLDQWDVSNVTTMRDMFLGTPRFNQPINNWNVSKVTDMHRMFDGFTRDMDFNQPLDRWDVSQVTNMETMFRKNINFNQDLSSWNVSNVANMEGMFEEADVFNQNLEDWDVSNLKNSSSMFKNAIAYNQPMNRWNVSQVTNMAFMFDGATSFNRPLNNWDVSMVEDMRNMFANATSFDQILNLWNVTNVTDMRSMFLNATQFNSDITTWDVNSVVNMSSMFQGAASFNQPIGSWDVSAVAVTSSMFENAVSFNQTINAWNVSSVTLMDSMFKDAILFDQPLNSWNTESVTRFDRMFKGALVFNRNLNNWDTGEALNMQEMFAQAAVFDRPLNNWNVSFVLSMESMFEDATAFDQPLDSWNTASVNSMESMFKNATSFNNSIGSWNTRDVTTMASMFENATSFNSDINNWRVNAVVSMANMFQNASSFNQPLDRWSPGMVSMNSMFLEASSFNQSLANWDVSQVNDMTRMLDDTAINRENYDNTLIAWSERPLQPGISLGANGLLYCDALQERQSIIDNFSWNIQGDALNCPVPECTTLIVPLDAAVDVPVNTNLTWAPVTFASSYKISVRTDPVNSVPSNTLVDEIVTDSFYNFASDFAGGEVVYVTIIPTNVAGEAVGCGEFSFRVSETTTPTLPDCTTLIAPQNNETNVPIDANLQWSAVGNADSYRINIGTSAGGGEIVNDLNVGNATSYNPVDNLPEDATIYVTITPVNEEGEAVGCKEQQFETQIAPKPPVCTRLTLPVTDATGVSISTDISWAPVDNATGYLLNIATTVDGNELLNRLDVGNITTFNPAFDLPENRLIYVTITPYNDVGDAVNCDSESFRTASGLAVPDCTTLTTPVDGTGDVAVDTDLIWNTVATADGYRIFMGTTAGGNDIIDGLVVTGTSYDLPTDLNFEQQYFVRVIPFNTAGDATACTEYNFTTTAPPIMIPDCTTLTTPVNGAGDVAVDTDLIWNTVATADGYRIFMGTTAGGNDVIDGLVVTGTSYNLPTDLDFEQQYFVRVIPFNTAGDAAACAEYSFTTTAPPIVIPDCTTLTTPVNGAVEVAVDTFLEWNEVITADGYLINVGTTPGANDVVTNLEVVGNQFFFSELLLPSQNYFVSITPFNAAGNAINCGEEQFTTAAPIFEDNTRYGLSPNDDGINDFWLIDNIEDFPDNTVSIYNRWGVLVWQTTGYDNRSNVFTGKANRLNDLGADQLPQGTYFFKLDVSDPQRFNKTEGYLILKR